jgi:hypothetical protein
MATMRDVAEGLQILMKHEDPNSHSVCAEHDIIYAGSDHAKLPAEDVAALEARGWHLDEEFESWARFT